METRELVWRCIALARSQQLWLPAASSEAKRRDYDFYASIGKRNETEIHASETSEKSELARYESLANYLRYSPRPQIVRLVPRPTGFTTMLQLYRPFLSSFLPCLFLAFSPVIS